MATTDAITLARLDGTARRVLQHRLPRADAINELHAITQRPDLLTHAAGTALGAWQNNPVASWQGHDVAELLVEAGGDRNGAAEVARDVIDKLRRTTPRGIGE